MRTKKLLSLIIVFAMVLSSLTMAYGAVSDFSDMPDNWSTKALINAVDNGLLAGADNKIMPNEKLTRGQMATVINRAFGAKVKANIQSYVDVSTEAWYYDEMAKAVQMKTFQGAGNKLNPDDPITREQAFIVMARALKLEKSNEEPEGFSDLDNISSWAKEEVFSMIKAGYVKGSNGKINPKDTITRAEFAQLMSNLIKQYIDEAGEYTEISDGNIMVNASDVTLKDVKVTGDLIIGDGVGDGDVTLDNVEVTGRLLVRGGGEDTIIIKGNSNIQNIVIARVDGVVRVYNQSGEEIGEVIVDGSDDVILEGKFGSIELIADNIDVYALRADFSDSNITGSNSRIILPEEDDGSDRKSVKSVTVEGDTDFIGSTISAVVAPSSATVSYKWMISEEIDNNFVDIEGETSSSYEIKADDIGKFIKVEVRGTGDYIRTRVSEAVLIGFDGIDEDTGAYEIANWHHLDNVRYVLDGDFSMTSNLGPTEEVVPTKRIEENYETKGYDEVVGELGFEPIGQPVLVGQVSTFSAEDDFLSQLFTGNFDGKDNIIKGLFIDKQSNEPLTLVNDMSNTAGLFGIIYQAEIKNLTIKDSVIFGSNYAGALAGYSRESVLSNVHNKNEYSMLRGEDPASVVIGYSYTGGIVGINDCGTITNASNEAWILGEEYVGGIAGNNHVDYYDAGPAIMEGDTTTFESNITNSRNDGLVVGYRSIGGIAGSNGNRFDVAGIKGDIGYTHAPAYISKSYNTGYIIPIQSMFNQVDYYTSRIGGIVGENSGMISECYNQGIVGEDMVRDLTLENVEIAVSYEAEEVGGIAGRSNYDLIENNYNIGTIIGGNNVGGIVGYSYYGEITNNYNAGDLYRNLFMEKTLIIDDYQKIYGNNNGASFTGNYYLIEDLIIDNVEVKSRYPYGVYGRTIEELRNPLTYENEVYRKAIVEEHNWDFEDIWFMNLSTNNGLPILRWEEESFATEPSLNVEMPVFILKYGESTSEASINAEGMVEAYGQPLDGEFTKVDNIDGLTPGTYDLKTSFSVSGDSDFLSFIGYSELVVEKADLDITCVGSKEYGQEIVLNDLAGSPAVNNDVIDHITFTSEGTVTGAAVGVYDIIMTDVLIKDSGGIDVSHYYDYTLGTTVGTLTVIPRKIDVSAVTNTKTYDGGTESDGEPIVTSAIDVLDGHTGVWSQSFDNKNAGVDKTLTPTGKVVRDSDNTDMTDNYDINFVTTTGSITALDLTLDSFTSSDKVYDGNVSGSGSFDDNRLNGDELTFDYTVEFEDKNVGIDKIVSFANISINGGADQDNYNLVTTTGSAVADITPKSLEVKADDKSKPYDGGSFESFTVSYSGFEGDDDKNDLNGSLDFTGSAIDAKNVGTYTITPFGYTSTNYDITFANGTLTINKADPIVTWPDTIYAARNEVITVDDFTGESSNASGDFTVADDTTSWSAVGAYSLDLGFTPDDTLNYNTATSSIDVIVEELIYESIDVNTTSGEIDLMFNLPVDKNDYLALEDFMVVVKSGDTDTTINVDEIINPNGSSDFFTIVCNDTGDLEDMQNADTIIVVIKSTGAAKLIDNGGNLLDTQVLEREFNNIPD